MYWFTIFLFFNNYDDRKESYDLFQYETKSSTM